jgi:hypothetical protein
MLEEEQENKNVFIRKIEQYLQEMSELSKVMPSISVAMSLDNMIIMPVYFIYLECQNQDLIKKKNRIVILWPRKEPGIFMKKYSIVLQKVKKKN